MLNNELRRKDMTNKDYVVVVQCQIVKERCSGYYCEHAFSERSGLFTEYPKGEQRYLSMSCGGCCGRAVLPKLSSLIKQIKKKEKIEKDRIVVHLSSCISFESYHAPPCPHKEYIKTLIGDRLGLDLVEGSKITDLTDKRRREGKYAGR